MDGQQTIECKRRWSAPHSVTPAPAPQQGFRDPKTQEAALVVTGKQILAHLAHLGSTGQPDSFEM
jgi:hypothetical protein